MIPNIPNYRGSHEATQQVMVEVIYNLLPPTTKVTSLDLAERERLKNQAIRMSLICECGCKRIIIFFPNEITQEQVNLLQAYQNTYGNIVERISREYEQESENKPIVVFENGDNDNYSHSFENAINYAQTLPIIERNEAPIEIIIGSIISSENFELCRCEYEKSLRGFLEEAQERGITPEDVEAFRRHAFCIINSRRGIDK